MKRENSDGSGSCGDVAASGSQSVRSLHPVRHAFAFEESLRTYAFQNRKCAPHAGLHAGRCRDGNGVRGTAHGFTTARIEDVREAPPAPCNVPIGVPAGGKRAAVQLQRSGSLRRGRRCDRGASIPTRHAAPSRRGAVTARSPPKFTSTGSELMARPRRPRYLPRTPCRYRRNRSPCRAAASARAVANRRATIRRAAATVDLGRRWRTRAAVELPRATQDAAGDVELALRQAPQVLGEVEQPGGFLVHLDGSPAARLMRVTTLSSR